jgi:energy-coupling factor transporter ATP-binding protein EcfA2
MPNLNIRAFDPSTMKPDATVLLIGKRGTGKSTLINDIMYHMRDKFQFGIAMSPTEGSTEALSTIIPRTCIFNDFCENAIGRMLKYQKKSVKQASEKKYRNMFIIMDDCAYDSKTLKGKNIREVFMNGRHRKIFIINAVQYMMDIPSFLRGQIDYVFATRDNIIDQREKLWKYFFGMFSDYRDFSAVMDNCTANHNVIVLNNTVRSNDPQECVYWYCANPDLPSFKLCDDVYWQLDAKYFECREDDDDDNGKVQPLVVTRCVKK